MTYKRDINRKVVYHDNISKLATIFWSEPVSHVCHIWTGYNFLWKIQSSDLTINPSVSTKAEMES